jgi:type I restriction enzyme S subunit
MNDLILAREAPIGNVAIILPNQKVCLGQRTVLIRPDQNKIIPQYLCYLLLGDEIQGRAYDDLIENNTRRIRILEEMAQALYREWFVKFRFPGHENVEMVESELGLVPEGWGVKKLADVIELAYGKALKAENRIDGPVPVYGSGGIVGHHNESLAEGPGIIVGRKGNVGSVYWSDDDFFAIDTVFYVRSKVSLPYIYYNLRSQNFINNDAAVPGLNRNQAYLLPFLLPNVEILSKFENFVNEIFKHTKNLRIKNANLIQTRNLLLPKLISGEVNVETLEIQGGY